MPELKIIIIVLLTSLLCIDMSFGQINVVPLNKFEFLVATDNNIPLTVYYGGKAYPVDIDVRNKRDLISDILRLGGVNRRETIALYTKIQAAGRSYSKDSRIFLDRSLSDLERAIASWALKFGLDTDQVWELLLYNGKEDRAILDLLKGIYAGSALVELSKILDDYNLGNLRRDRGYRLESLFVEKTRRFYRPVNPTIIAEVYSPLQYRNDGGIWQYNYLATSPHGKLSLGLIPDIYFSKEAMVVSKLYLTGSYAENQIYLNPDNVTDVFVPLPLVSGASDVLTPLKNKEQIYLENTSLSLGLKFNTHFGTAFATFVEGGFTRQLTDYNLRFDGQPDSYFELGKSLRNPTVERAGLIKEAKHQPFFTMGMSVILAKKGYVRRTRRGFYVSAHTTIKKYDRITSNGLSLVDKDGNSLFPNQETKFKPMYGISIGLTL